MGRIQQVVFLTPRGTAIADAAPTLIRRPSARSVASALQKKRLRDPRKHFGDPKQRPLTQDVTPATDGTSTSPGPSRAMPGMHWTTPDAFDLTVLSLRTKAWFPERGGGAAPRLSWSFGPRHAQGTPQTRAIFVGQSGGFHGGRAPRPPRARYARPETSGHDAEPHAPLGMAAMVPSKG